MLLRAGEVLQRRPVRLFQNDAKVDLQFPSVLERDRDGALRAACRQYATNVFESGERLDHLGTIRRFAEQVYVADRFLPAAQRTGDFGPLHAGQVADALE